MNVIAQWFADNLDTIISSAEVIIGMGVIIFIHELGHFFFARRVGCRIDVFSVGMGPRLFGFKKGETDYRVSLIPFGGYVKIFGQGGIEEKEGDKNDPRFFENKTPGQRFWVFVAGVMMNFLIAIPLFIIVNCIGQRVPDNTITEISDGSPAFAAGIEPGDVLLGVVNNPATAAADITDAMWAEGATETWDTVVRRFMIRKDDENLWLKIKRGDETRVVMLPADELRSEDAMMYRINSGMNGLETVLAVKSLTDGSPGKGKLKPKDIIAEVDGVEIKNGDDLRKALNAVLIPPVAWKPCLELYGKPTIGKITLAVKREIGDNEYEDIVFDGYRPEIATFYDLPFEVYNRAAIGVLQKDSPAEKAGLKKDDVITEFGIEGDMKLVEYWSDIEDRYAALKDKATGKFLVRVRRLAEPIAITARDADDVAEALGIYFPKGLYIKSIPPDSPLLDLPQNSRPRVGDLVTGVDEMKLNDDFVTAEDMRLIMSGQYALAPGGNPKEARKITLLYRTPQMEGEDKTVGIRLMLNYRPMLGIVPGDGIMPDALVLNKKPFGEAVVKGLEDPFSIIKLTVEMFSTKRVGIGHVSGPVGIFEIARKSAEQSFADLIYILAFISVNLAVLNILPIPVLDGGHIMFLIVEKIRGKKISEKVRGKLEIIGLVALLTLIVVALKNDFFNFIL